MLVCDECRKSSEEVPLGVKGIVYTGKRVSKEYIVFSVLCEKCDTGEVIKQVEKQMKEAK